MSARQSASPISLPAPARFRFGSRGSVACHAVEGDDKALDALDHAARNTQGLKPVSVEKRDLFRRPLMTSELKVYDAVVFDPPRAGAEFQCKELARSAVKKIVAVSCNPLTLARDLAHPRRGRLPHHLRHPDRPVPLVLACRGRGDAGEVSQTCYRWRESALALHALAACNLGLGRLIERERSGFDFAGALVNAHDDTGRGNRRFGELQCARFYAIAEEALAPAEHERKGQYPELVDQIMRHQGLQQAAASLGQQRTDHPPVSAGRPPRQRLRAGQWNFVQVSGSGEEVATYFVTLLKRAAMGSSSPMKGQYAAKIS